MTERLLFSNGMLRRMPPWLQRVVGAKVVQGLVDPVDALVLSSVAAVRARFPSADMPDALALIGSDRRIRRGLAESATTYARRLRSWWTAHRTRGGPYALLNQLDLFFEDWLNVRMDLVAQSGNRHWIDAASVVTHDAIMWGGDATGKWARFWVFFYLPADTIPSPIGGAFIVTDDGSFIVTDDGSFLVTDGELTASALSAAEIEMFSCIAREWSAAHIDEINVVLLWADRRLWNYPQPVPTWSAWGGTSTWAEPPVIISVTQ